VGAEHGDIASDSEHEQLVPNWRDSYDMDLSLDVSGKRLFGIVRLAAKNSGDDAWSNLCLRDHPSSALDLFASDLKDNNLFSDELREFYSEKELESGIESAHDLRTGKALGITRDDDKSIYFVELEEPLEPGSTVEIEMRFSFDIPPGAYTVSYRALDTASYRSDGQNISFELAYFYPILSVRENGEWIANPNSSLGESFYSRSADYSAKLSLPSGYTVASSGDEHLASESGGNAVWEMRGENMRDFTISASNHRSIANGESCGVVINVLYPSNDVKYESKYEPSPSIRTAEEWEAIGESVLSAAEDSVDLYSELFGECFYSELDVVVCDIRSAGMENVGLVRVSLSCAGIAPSQLRLLVAHEIAHEWFYAAVGNDQYSESWLDEGFATFAAALFMRAEGLEVDAPSPQIINRPLKHYVDNGSGMGPIYSGGRSLLWSLMDEMGEEDFFGMIRLYYESYKGKEAKTGDFIEIVNKWTHNDPDVEKIIKLYIE
jgi:hypothetical protein